MCRILIHMLVHRESNSAFFPGYVLTEAIDSLNVVCPCPSKASIGSHPIPSSPQLNLPCKHWEHAYLEGEPWKHFLVLSNGFALPPDFEYSLTFVPPNHLEPSK